MTSNSSSSSSSGNNNNRNSTSSTSNITSNNSRHHASPATAAASDSPLPSDAESSVSVAASAAANSSYLRRNSDFHSVFPHVPLDEHLVDDFSCALQSDILLHGRLYLSDTSVCFHSSIFGKVTRIILSLAEVAAVEKRMTAFVIPNALHIATMHQSYTFSSLLNRDRTHDLILELWRPFQHSPLQQQRHSMSEEAGAGTGVGVGANSAERRAEARQPVSTVNSADTVDTADVTETEDAVGTVDTAEMTDTVDTEQETATNDSLAAGETAHDDANADASEYERDCDCDSDSDFVDLIDEALIDDALSPLLGGDGGVAFSSAAVASSPSPPPSPSRSPLECQQQTQTHSQHETADNNSNNINNDFDTMPTSAPTTGEPVAAPPAATVCPCEERSEHYKHVLLDAVYPVPMAMLSELLWNNHAPLRRPVAPEHADFMRRFMEGPRNGCWDYEVGEWTPVGPDDSPTERPPLTAVETRASSFVEPLHGPIGPKQAKCFVEAVCVNKDYARAATVDQAVAVPDVPSGGVFKAHTRTCVMHAGPGPVRDADGQPQHQTRVIGSYKIVWSGSSWFKAIIERETLSANTKYYRDLDEYIREYLAAHPELTDGRVLAPSSGVAAVAAVGGGGKPTVAGEQSADGGVHRDEFGAFESSPAQRTVALPVHGNASEDDSGGSDDDRLAEGEPVSEKRPLLASNAAFPRHRQHHHRRESHLFDDDKHNSSAPAMSGLAFASDSMQRRFYLLFGLAAALALVVLAAAAVVVCSQQASVARLALLEHRLEHAISDFEHAVQRLDHLNRHPN